MCSWPCLPGQFVDLAKGELTVVDNPILNARKLTPKCNTQPQKPMQEQQPCVPQETVAEENMEWVFDRGPLLLDIASQIVNTIVRIYQTHFDKESKAAELDNNELRDWIEALFEQLS